VHWASIRGVSAASCEAYWLCHRDAVDTDPSVADSRFHNTWSLCDDSDS
jgi:hypothetical protein